jgi:hypothetical protein
MQSNLHNVLKLEPQYKKITGEIFPSAGKYRPVPVSVSGLCDGAAFSMLLCIVEDAKTSGAGCPIIIIGSEKEAAKIISALSAGGFVPVHFPAREQMLHNISASREV